MAELQNKEKITSKSDTVVSFIDADEEDIQELLESSKTKNTNRSTKSFLTRLHEYLCHANLPPLEEIDIDELPKILTNFYMSVRMKKTGELYQTSSFKVLHVGLNKWFKQNKEVDIVSDERFMRANLVFDGVQVKAKKTGKGRTKNTPPISEEDLKKIGQYFAVDHVARPSPQILQQCMQFYIMYFFCHRGQENLYEMTQDHFKVHVEPDGTCHVYQNIDEKDKNHGIYDTEATNQGHMYEDTGMFN